MAINTQIAQSDWLDFFVTFSNGNRGRKFGMEVFDSESGSTGQARQGKLMAVDYDPVGKGNDIVVTSGVDEIDYSHTIEAPAEVWQEQLDNGEVAALAIIDRNQVKTVLNFEADDGFRAGWIEAFKFGFAKLAGFPARREC